MKIGFHEDHWWILVNGQKAYRLSIPRDISPEEARKHATNVLIYLAERAEIVHNLGASREGTTEGQPSGSLADRSSGSCTRADVREFDEIQALTAHVDRLADQLFGHTCAPSLRDPSVGRDPVHAAEGEDPPAVVKSALKAGPPNIVDICIDVSPGGNRAEVRYEDMDGRRLKVIVRRAEKWQSSYEGWMIDLAGSNFLETYTNEDAFPPAIYHAYRSRTNCADACWTFLSETLRLPSAF